MASLVSVRKVMKCTFGMLLVGLPFASAHAAGGITTLEDEAAATSGNVGEVGYQQPADNWEFSITPYLWATGEKGNVGVIPGIEPVDLDLSFGDIFHNLEFTAMTIIQARKGRLVAMADLAYVRVGADKGIGIRDPEFKEADLTSTSFTTTLAGGYRAIEKGATFLDLMGGIRITSSKTELDLIGPIGSVSGERKETWVDPIVGVRFHNQLGKKWAGVIYGDVGGVGLSSNITWQLQGAIQYQIGEQWWLSAGWRHYVIDYDKGDFIYDVKMSGPIVGVAIYF